jgi:hypothetical protein
MFAWLDRLPWLFVAGAVLTLGLAPYAPPHFFEKLRMLFAGTLKRPIDVFDFLFHGLPWLLLAAKAIREIAGLRGQVGL